MIICGMHDVKKLINGGDCNDKQWQISVDGPEKVEMYHV